MATIVLEPGENFEHFHSGESQTVLLSGDVTMSLDGETRKLEVNEPVYVPANVSHTLINNGLSVATVGCIH